MQEELKQEEIEIKDEQMNEQEEYIDPQQQAKEELEKEEGIEFSQTLTKDDIKEMNLFLIKHDPSSFVKRSFLVFVGGLFIALSIINKKNYYMIALGSIVIIYATILYTLLRVMYLKNRLDKNPLEPLDIDIKIGTKYIRYQLKEETDSPLVSFEHIYKVPLQNKILKSCENVFIIFSKFEKPLAPLNIHLIRFLKLISKNEPL